MIAERKMTRMGVGLTPTNKLSPNCDKKNAWSYRRIGGFGSQEARGRCLCNGKNLSWNRSNPNAGVSRFFVCLESRCNVHKMDLGLILKGQLDRRVSSVGQERNPCASQSANLWNRRFGKSRERTSRKKKATESERKQQRRETG